MSIHLQQKFSQRNLLLQELKKKSIVSIGTYGCCKKKKDKFYLKEGLKAMLEELEPIVVLVYGAMPKSIFGEFMNRTKFVHFDDWTKVKHHSKG